MQRSDPSLWALIDTDSGPHTSLPTSSDLDSFLARIDIPTTAAQIALAENLDVLEVQRILGIYLNEVASGLQLITPYLQPHARILEVGSGIGVLAAFLSCAGYHVVSLEPSTSGFDLMSAIRETLSQLWPDTTLVTLTIPAERLDPTVHGAFDFVYSVNVLEHVDDLPSVLRSIHSVLAVGAKSVHMTPNYTIPYEPHFGLPLVPFRPGLTRILFPSRLGTSDVWESLNFVTGRGVRKIGKELGLDISLSPGIVHSMSSRILKDQIFRARHAALARLVLAVWNRPRIGVVVQAVLRKWPSAWASPMVFGWRRIN